MGGMVDVKRFFAHYVGKKPLLIQLNQFLQSQKLAVIKRKYMV
jgi:hypothetical protein